MSNESNFKKLPEECFFVDKAMEPHFFYFDKEQIYAIEYMTKKEPLGIVIFNHAFGLEREFSYLSISRFAKYLTHFNFNCLIFDYRGTGESSGNFIDFSWEDWQNDLIFLYNIYKTKYPNLPIILFGFRFGALNCSFVQNKIKLDGLLIWDYPSSARAMLMEILRRKLISDVLDGYTKTTRQFYIDELLNNNILDIEGFYWTKKLWIESENYKFMYPQNQKFHIIKFEDSDIHKEQESKINIPRPPFWGTDPMINPLLGELFKESKEIIIKMVI